MKRDGIKGRCGFVDRFRFTPLWDFRRGMARRFGGMVGWNWKIADRYFGGRVVDVLFKIEEVACLS